MPGNGNDSAPEATNGASLARAMVSCITVIKVAYPSKHRSLLVVLSPAAAFG
jgi:hypothetical protein